MVSQLKAKQIAKAYFPPGCDYSQNGLSNLIFIYNSFTTSWRDITTESHFKDENVTKLYLKAKLNDELTLDRWDKIIVRNID